MEIKDRFLREKYQSHRLRGGENSVSCHSLEKRGHLENGVNWNLKLHCRNSMKLKLREDKSKGLVRI